MEEEETSARRRAAARREPRQQLKRGCVTDKASLSERPRGCGPAEAAPEPAREGGRQCWAQRGAGRRGEGPVTPAA